jgi:hypothetical protein
MGEVAVRNYSAVGSIGSRSFARLDRTPLPEDLRERLVQHPEMEARRRSFHGSDGQYNLSGQPEPID